MTTDVLISLLAIVYIYAICALQVGRPLKGSVEVGIPTSRMEKSVFPYYIHLRGHFFLICAEAQFPFSFGNSTPLLFL